jgi:hypothetical protein
MPAGYGLWLRAFGPARVGAMSWLKASRKVVDPQGVAWDIYVTRVRVGDPGHVFEADDPPAGYGFGLASIGMMILGLVGELANALLRGLVRLTMLLPVGLVRSRFGITRRIEAIADWPQRRTLLWTVEGPPGDLLLDEIARGIERGAPPSPAGATYLGEQP